MKSSLVAAEALIVGQQWKAVVHLLDVLYVAGVQECPVELATAVGEAVE